MGMFDSLRIAASGMTAERLRMDVTAENLANASTTRGPDGKPFQRKEVVLAEGTPTFDQVLNGVRVAGVVNDPSPPRRVYDPGHPDADKDGYVTLPIVGETMASSTRSRRASSVSGYPRRRDRGGCGVMLL